MNKFKGLVGDVYSVFTDTSTDTLRLTPKEDFNKISIFNPKIFHEGSVLKHTQGDAGDLYLRVLIYDSVENCSIEFDYDGDLPAPQDPAT